jgi:hypothetical protein
MTETFFKVERNEVLKKFYEPGKMSKIFLLYDFSVFSFGIGRTTIFLIWHY